MDVKSLRKMTVAELREEAKKLGDAKGIASMKKEELVQLLAGGDSSAARPGRGEKVVGLGLAALKQRVRELKAKRTHASGHGQKAKVTEYNEQIRRYRRMLRRAARRQRKPS